MNAIYKLKSDKKIEVYLENDVLRGISRPKTVSGYVLDEKGNKSIAPDFEAKVLSDEEGKLYFVLNYEKVYIKNFVALSIGELINRVNSDEELTRNELVATLMKYRNDMAFVFRLVYGALIGVEDELICVPAKGNITDEDWEIGITLIPRDVSSFDTSKPIYVLFDELLEKIKTGEVIVVYKDAYKGKSGVQMVYETDK